MELGKSKKGAGRRSFEGLSGRETLLSERGRRGGRTRTVLVGGARGRGGERRWVEEMGGEEMGRGDGRGGDG
eukprot:759458-Hanusia_phi.AAC.2